MTAPIDESVEFAFRPGRLVCTFTAGMDRPVVVSGLGTEGDVTAGAGWPLVELLVAGYGHVGNVVRHTETAIGARLRHVRHEIADGTCRIVQRDPGTGLEVTTVLSAAEDVAALRAYTEVRNAGSATHVLEAVSSLVVPIPIAAAEDPRDLDLVRGQSEQVAEYRWSRARLFGPTGLPAHGLDPFGQHGRGAIAGTGISTWSTGADLPTGAVVNAATGRGLAWQIEHNGGWRWEIADGRTGPEAAALVLLGPTGRDHQWSQDLAPGARFTSVPVSIAVADTGFDGVIAELTRHRRWLRRDRATDPRHLLVFNDYMNTLNGDPTTAKLLPLIHAAAAAGAECFCIDAGWYDDTEEGNWWPSVGEWLPSTRRFPDGGLARVADLIAGLGMVFGLWLEPEVIGVDSPIVGALPDEAYLQRHGRRIVERDRYFLDLRHPAARAHLDATVDRLVADFGVGFFKFDYNVTPGAGTDRDANSLGAGLLAHNRAHLDWLDELRRRHPDVVIENCGSGAMRSDFAMLERLDFQSTSDQTDFRLYPPIAVGAPVQLLPEQAGNWAYAQPTMTPEEIACTMITGLSGRLYLSGFWNEMTPEQFGLVTDAIAEFTQIRGAIAASVPGWPLGLPEWSADRLALTLTAPDRTLVYVWHRGEADAEIRLPGVDAARLRERYPRRLHPWTVTGDDRGAVLRPGIAGPSARLYELV